MNIILQIIGAIFIFPITYILLIYVFYRIKQDVRFRERPILGNLFNLPGVVLGTLGYFIGYFIGFFLNFELGWVGSGPIVDSPCVMFLVPLSTFIFYLFGFWVFRRYARRE